MQTEDKLNSIYEGMLNEAPGKGFTLTCNKCNAEVQLIKKNKVTGKDIEVYAEAEEHEDGYSFGILTMRCKKCKNSWEYDESYD
jgi:hypothetical protein